MRTALVVSWVLWCAFACGAQPLPTRIVGMDYPILGQQARIEGEVKINVRLAGNGAIESVRVISGHPLLAKAAEQNIKQWRFTFCSTKSDTVLLTYRFVLDKQISDRPRTSFRYEHPYVFVVSEPRRWVPSGGAREPAGTEH